MSDTAQEALQRGWSSNSVAKPNLMAALQDRLSVALLATPRQALRTCSVDETVSEVMVRNTEKFDYFPVTDTTPHGRERIVGLIELVPYLHGRPADGNVRDHMLPLSEDNMVGADAGVLAFVRTADRHRCRLVISGAEVSGLVSLADLQKLPVRAALFAMITHLEMTMAEAIRREFDGADGWKNRLPKCRKAKLDSQRQAAKVADNWVDDLLLTQFADKTTIILKSPSFTASKTRFEKEMAKAQSLRDNLAHANEYARTRDSAAKVCAIVRNVENWIERLNEWLPAQRAAVEG
jgi:hypothetical protein